MTRASAATLILAAACAGDGDGESAALGAAPSYGGTLVVAGPADLEQANPLVSADAWTQEVNRFLLFMALVRHSRDLRYEPWLATSWTIHGDTALTFRLRHDVRWHDGRITTAHDVAFTYSRALDPATAYPNAGYLARWTGVEAIDSFTVRFQIQPHADPLAAAALLPVAPRHLLDTVPPDRLRAADFNRNPVGNGPFRFVSRQTNDRWVFEANRTFPAELGGRPYLDRLVWRVVTERTAQVTELLAGEADLVLASPAERFDELGARPGIRRMTRPSFKYQFIGWNGRRAPFGDARVRRALTMALDRAAMLGSLRSGYGQLASGPVHPNHSAFDPSLEPLPHDTAAARALLASSGLVSGPDGTLRLPDGRAFAFQLAFQAGNTFARTTAELIQADLARIGVRVEPRAIEWNALVTAISSPSRDFDAVLMGWEADFRIDLHDLFHSSALDGPFQLASYRNSAVDSLLDIAARTTDLDAARPIWHDVQRILRDEQPWTFLYYYPDLLLAGDRFDGLEMDIRGVLAGAAGWRLAPRRLLAER